MLGKEAKFLLPPAVRPARQEPRSCTVSHSPADRAAPGPGLGAPVWTALPRDTHRPGLEAQPGRHGHGGTPGGGPNPPC